MHDTMPKWYLIDWTTLFVASCVALNVPSQCPQLKMVFPFADVASQTTMAGSRVAAVLVSSPSASDKAQWLLALAAFDCTDSAMEPGISHSEGVHSAKTDATVPAMKRKYRM